MDNTEAIFTEAEKQYLENTDIDKAMLFKEIKALKAEIKGLKSSISNEQSIEQKKAAIMSIKDTSKRLKAIRENIDLFR